MYPIAIMLPPLSLLADWTQPGTLSPVLPPTPVKRFKYASTPILTRGNLWHRLSAVLGWCGTMPWR